MNLNSSLFVVCSLAGFLLVAGSLYLLWKRIIFLDRESLSESEVELPGGFKIKTPVPVLVVFLLGVFLVVYPVYKNPQLCPDLSFHKKTPLEMVELRGKVATDTDIEVYAVVDEQKANASDSFVLTVPYVQNRHYVVRYTDKAGNELTQETFMLGPGDTKYELRGVQLRGAAPAAPPRIQLEQSEPSDTVALFK
jgi:hypothetical protein